MYRPHAACSLGSHHVTASRDSVLCPDLCPVNCSPVVAGIDGGLTSTSPGHRTAAGAATAGKKCRVHQSPTRQAVASALTLQFTHWRPYASGAGYGGQLKGTPQRCNLQAPWLACQSELIKHRLLESATCPSLTKPFPSGTFPHPRRPPITPPASCTA